MDDEKWIQNNFDDNYGDPKLIVPFVTDAYAIAAFGKNKHSEKEWQCIDITEFWNDLETAKIMVLNSPIDALKKSYSNRYDTDIENIEFWICFIELAIDKEKKQKIYNVVEKIERIK